MTGVCAVGSSIRQINVDGTVVCEVDDNSGGTVTVVGTGSGLTGGPITTSGTISIAAGGVNSCHIADGTIGVADVNPAQIQLRVTGSCAVGSAITAINPDGTVICQSAGSGGVTSVTVSPPLVSSGGTTPHISLPDVIINAAAGNTAIGASALSSTTGFNNTVSGAGALNSNTTGFSNTASGGNALLNNTTGQQNTASGASALLRNTTGLNNTASGASALINNTTGNLNTASGLGALNVNATGHDNTAIGAFANVSTVDLTNATAIGAGAVVDASNKIRLGNQLVTVVEGRPIA